MKLLAIGGGDLATQETLVLDREFVAMSGKEHPNALFLPTASGDDLGYGEVFQAIYADVLGCPTDVLRVAAESPPSAEIAAKVRWADLVYVGGGNTKAMLERWRAVGLDRLLREAAEEGKPLGGVSAGAICWFRVGCSDWPLFEGRTDIRTGPVEGLGFVGAAACPHTVREEHRLDDFREMMRQVPGVGLGIDDLCGLQIVDGRCRVLSAGGGAGLHRVQWVDGRYRHRFIRPSDPLSPVPWQSLSRLIPGCPPSSPLERGL